MATHYGGIGDTSMENPKSQDVDSDSQENYQEENIISLQHLTCEMEQLRQTVEDKKTMTLGMPYNSWNKSLIN